MPWVRLIIMCHKMVIFLSTYKLLSRLVFKHDPSFLWKTNFKSKPDALSKEGDIKHFCCGVGRQNRLNCLVLLHFPTETKSPKTEQAFSV